MTYKNTYFKKITTAFVLSFVMAFTVGSVAYATESQDTLEKEISALEKELDSINGELLEMAKEQVQIEDQIAKTQEEMQKTKLDLEKNRIQQIEQYENMKVRIRYMYEEGQTSLLEILFASDNLADFINKSDFIYNVTEYDKSMLNSLADIGLKIELEEENLIAQEKTLLALDENLTALEQILNEKAEATSTDLSQVKDKLQAIEKAQEEAKAKAEAEEAAKKKAEEEALKQESAATGSTSTGQSYDGEAGELDIFAAILDCEAGAEYNSMLAVATVIMNRVNSGRFPDSITGVVYQAGQFSPTWTGKLDRIIASGATALAYRVAQAAMNGSVYESVSHCYYFNASWATNKTGVNVGGNIFFASW